MARITLNQPYNMQASTVWMGTVAEATANRIVISNGPNAAVYEGSFTYSAYGTPMGTLVRFSESLNGATLYTVDGFSADAATVASYVASGNLRSLYAYVLGGSDTITGSAGRDVLNAFGGSDSVAAGGGDDVMIDDGGSDRYDGGAGRDTVVVSGSRGSVKLAQTNGGWTVEKLYSYETETLVSVERITFSDRTIALDLDGAAGQTYRLYQAAFSRTPDQAGLSHNVRLIDDGLALRDMSAAFVGSAEFRQRYGESLSDEAFINALYRNVLGRDGEAAGVAGWKSYLQQAGHTRADVLIGFSESAENKALVGVAISGGITLDL